MDQEPNAESTHVKRPRGKATIVPVVGMLQSRKHKHDNESNDFGEIWL